MPVRTERLAAAFEALGKIGWLEDGGYARFAYGPHEREATALVEGWMREAGMQTRRDSAGNLFGRLDGRTDAPAVLTGSHLDSVPHGGNFDGPAGVLCALEAVRSIRESGRVPAKAIEIVSFQGEEGSRFPHGLLGSSLIAGTFHGSASELSDQDGVTLAEALRNAGFGPEKLPEARRPRGSWSAFVELHIEQSVVLESRGLACGVVTHIAALRQFAGWIGGRTDHAGACPMDLRRDTLAAAAEVVLEVERAARESDPATRATVGRVRAHPGATNVIAGRTEFSLDIRDQDERRLDAALGRIRGAFEGILSRRGLTGGLVPQHSSPSVPCDPAVVGAIEAAGVASGIPLIRLPSGAVHDASNMARLCPIGMIFVRCRGGISHSPEEHATSEDLSSGARLLEGALERLSGL